MESPTFTVSFGPDATNSGEPLSRSGEVAMESLISQGVICFQLDWNRDFQALLAVEDDVLFLFETYGELSGFLAGAAPQQVYLGDGELVIAAHLEDSHVIAKVAHTPHLSAGLRREYQYKMTPEDYEASWRNVINQLLEQVRCRTSNIGCMR